MVKITTKSQLTRHLATKLEIPRKTATALLDALASTAVKQTRSVGQFVVPGIGKLVKAARKARMGRNPQTGGAIEIPARIVVKFRVSKAAKTAMVGPKGQGGGRPNGA